MVVNAFVAVWDNSHAKGRLSFIIVKHVSYQMKGGISMSTTINTANTSKTDGVIIIALAAIVAALWAVGVAIN